MSLKTTRLPQLSGTDENGFTIIELMIATAVFAVVMIVLIFGVIQISNSYFRGITQANTQNTARNVLNDITQALQYDGTYSTPAPPAPDPANPPRDGTTVAFCVGSQQYNYIVGYELKNSYSTTTHQTAHGLVQASGVAGDGSCPAPQDLSGSSVSGTELLSQDMRLANLSIQPFDGGDFYTVEVRVVYGDDDLLNNPTQANASCKAGAGSQFCAVSDLSTIVQERVN